MAAGLNEEEAVKIAMNDARENYVDPEKYKVHVAMNNDVWMVDLEPIEPTDIGGASFLISTENGKILQKRYI